MADPLVEVYDMDDNNDMDDNIEDDSMFYLNNLEQDLKEEQLMDELLLGGTVGNDDCDPDLLLDHKSNQGDDADDVQIPGDKQLLSCNRSLFFFFFFPSTLFSSFKRRGHA